MLSISGLSHTYPNGTDALRDVTLTVARGEIVAIVGPSGCGKSTLLRLIAGLMTPMQGTIILDDQPITQPSSRIGIMFQDAALLPWRTVEANVRLPTEVGDRETRDGGVKEAQSGAPAPRRNAGAGAPARANLAATKSPIPDLLNLVGLTDFAQSFPRDLSGGMAQRAALARALVTQPPLLLLDEPFGALDAMTRESLTASLETIVRDTGTTAIMVTHNIAEAVFLADRVLVLSPRPGHIAGIIDVSLPRPRAWAMESTPEFGAHVGQVRETLMNSALRNNEIVESRL